MSIAKKKLIVATVAWGDWHLTALTDYTLPSLLAPGNFPHLARDFDIEYLIITRPAEQARVEAAPSLRRAREFMVVHVLPALPAEIDTTADIFHFHHSMWEFASDRAKQVGAYVFNLPPDSVFADGAGVTWSELMRQDKKSIFWVFPRAVDRVQLALKDYAKPDGSLVISPRELVNLNLRYLHPISKAFCADSDHFPTIHPEMVLWPVKGEGYVLRVFVGEARLYDPSRVELNDQHVITGEIRPDEHAFVDDSDRLYTIAIAPPTHNASWYDRPARARTGAIGRWWLKFDGTSNDWVARHQVRIHTGTRTPALWRAREGRADLFMSRAVAAREFIRMSQAALEVGCSWAASLLFQAAMTGAALRAIPRPVEGIALIPEDVVLRAIVMEDLLLPSGARRLARLLKSHIIPVYELGPDEVKARLAASNGILRMRSLAGKEVVFERQADHATVNGHRLGAESWWRAGGLLVASLAGRLDEEAGADAAVACERALL